MKYFFPIDPTITASNIADNEDENGNNYIDYDIVMGYNKGVQRKQNNKIYESVTTIYPLAHYLWENLIIGSEYAVNLHTQTEVVDPTVVPIVQNVTVVYVRSNNTYYIAKTTGNVDFTSEDIQNPSNFNEITDTPPPYRHEYDEPLNTTGSSLYWKYISVSNKQRPFDRAMSSQAEKVDEITYTFEVDSVSALAVFNTNATEINIVVVDNLSMTEIYNSTMEMSDTSHLDNYEKVCTQEPKQKENAVFQFDSSYSSTIELTIAKTGSNAKAGVIKMGLVETLGTTLDGVPVDTKSYNESGQRDNGEYVWNPNDLETNKVFVLSYNMLWCTGTFDSNTGKLKEITDKEIILLGDDGDPEGFTTLTNYGAITDTNSNLMSNSSHSEGSLTIENFI